MADNLESCPEVMGTQNALNHNDLNFINLMSRSEPTGGNLYDVCGELGLQPASELLRQLAGGDASGEQKNSRGDTYRLDKDGRITEFTYQGKDGKGVAFKNIQYDKDGQVNSFVAPDGMKFDRLPKDPKSPWESEREGNGWRGNGPDGVRLRSPADLGKVTFDKEKGIRVSGSNADSVWNGIPPDKRPRR